MLLEWPPPDSPTIVVLLAAAALFVVFHFAASAERWRAWLERGSRPAAGPERPVHLQRLSGAVLFGLLPLAIAAVLLPEPVTHYGLQGDPLRSVSCAAGILAVTLPVILVASRKPGFRDHYPEIRRGHWDGSARARSALTWCIYLLAYEFFFRGFLLFSLADAFGPWPAIAITTLAYVLAHLPTNRDEAVATIPMGVVFGAAALWCGGMWPAFLAHAVIANASDVLASRQDLKI
jgi:membrane protease YdiL (CAAX protease family)